MRIGVVSGLLREATCLESINKKPRNFDTFSGVGPKLAAKAADEFVNAGAGALMSFGVAGGLSEALPAGTIVLATAVVDGEQTHKVDQDWLSRLSLALTDGCDFVIGEITGTDTFVPSPKKKQELRNITGALACDMESHAVARVAVLNDLPFAVVRVIADPHDRVAPDWVFRCLTISGEIKYFRVFLEAFRRPSTWRDLISLSRDSKKAFNSLHGVASCLGPNLSF